MIVENRGEVVGYLTEARPDMWYLDGVFEPVSSEAGARFASAASKLDSRAAMKDPKQGIRTLLRESPDDEGCLFVVMALNQGRMFGRRVFQPEAVAYALAEIAE